MHSLQSLIPSTATYMVQKFDGDEAGDQGETQRRVAQYHGIEDGPFHYHDSRMAECGTWWVVWEWWVPDECPGQSAALSVAAPRSPTPIDLEYYVPGPKISSIKPTSSR